MPDTSIAGRLLRVCVRTWGETARRTNAIGVRGFPCNREKFESWGQRLRFLTIRQLGSTRLAGLGATGRGFLLGLGVSKGGAGTNSPGNPRKRRPPSFWRAAGAAKSNQARESSRSGVERLRQAPCYAFDGAAINSRSESWLARVVPQARRVQSGWPALQNPARICEAALSDVI